MKNLINEDTSINTRVSDEVIGKVLQSVELNANELGYNNAKLDYTDWFFYSFLKKIVTDFNSVYDKLDESDSELVSKVNFDTAEEMFDVLSYDGYKLVLRRSIKNQEDIRLTYTDGEGIVCISFLDNNLKVGLRLKNRLFYEDVLHNEEYLDYLLSVLEKLKEVKELSLEEEVKVLKK